MTQLLPNGKQQFVDGNGRPLVGGKVYFYSVGTSTPKDTYQDSAQTSLNTNPVILNARGQASIYGSGAYRQVLRDAFGSLIWDQVIPDPDSALNGFQVDLANPTDPAKGAALVARSSIHIDNVKLLMSAPRQPYFAFILAGYHESGVVNAAENLGGGRFYYRPDIAKSKHDGGVYIDPDRLSSYPTDWSNEAQKTAWYSASGVGNGVFVRVAHRRIELEQ